MSKNVINNNEKKNKVMNAVVIIAAIVIVFGLAIMVSNEKGRNSSKHIKEVSYSEYEKKIKDNDYTIVLLASPSCTHCMQYKPLMNKVADDFGLEVYYIDVSSRNLKNDEYMSLHDNISVLKDVYNDEGEPSISTPTTVIYKDGVEIDAELGNIGEKGFLDLLNRNGVIA